MGLRFALRAAAVALCLPLLCLSPLAGAQGPAPVAAAQTAADLALLLERSLAVPVEGVSPADLHDTFSEGRPGHRHEAIDIAAPRGSKVFAVDGGKLVKLFTSVPGGLTLYQFDPQERFVYYYAHLDRYADGLREGMILQRCDLLGYVGTSGNAAAGAPHLHFAVFRLGPDKHWWQGTALDPYPALTQAQRAAAPGPPCPQRP